MREITHNHTVRPVYRRESESGRGTYTREWESARELDHSVPSPRMGRRRYPVVFDVETTAKVPQRPLIVTAYDSKERRLHIFVSRRYYDGEWFDDGEIEEIVSSVNERWPSVVVLGISIHHTTSGPWFENTVLSKVINDDSRVLVGHNAFFDLNILGQPNDGLLDHVDEWESATEYEKYTLLSKRAGAYGRVYSIVEHNPLDFDPQIEIADTMVTAKALQLPGSLTELCEHFQMETTESDTHGVLDAEYMAYNIDDVFATYMCYLRLREMLDETFGTTLRPEDVFSTASIFKNVLGRTGVDRVHYTTDALDVIASSYFGGRTQAMAPGKFVEDVAYLDILSEYPTVSALTNVWDFMYVEEIDIEYHPPEDLPKPYDYTVIGDPEFWVEASRWYVVIETEGSTLPVRTKVPGYDSTRVQTAKVTHAEGVTTTHHFFDAISAWMIDGKWPDIKAAYRIESSGQQEVKSTQIAGEPIEPGENILKRSIEKRKESAGDNELAFKITANAGYGVSAERIVVDDTAGHTKYDAAGKYYNPHVAATITAGGRMMLAYGERVAQENGGNLWYCDTDSLIVDSEVAEPLQRAFDSLNPYDGTAGELDVLEIETVDDGKTELIHVDFIALDVKKYAVLKDGELIKFTEHALGVYDQFRDSETVERFWISLLKWEEIPVGGEPLDIGELEEPILIEYNASTRFVRENIELRLEKRIRYGEWVKLTVSADDRHMYVCLDIESNGIRFQKGGPKKAELVDMKTEDVKTVMDVFNEWKTKSILARGQDLEVKIVKKRAVTKESTTLRRIIENTFEAILQNLDLDIALEVS